MLFLIGSYYFLPQISKLGPTLAVAKHAAWGWLTIAVIASGLTSCLAAVIQFGAGNFSGTLADLVVVQFAGSFANHFLPYSLAGIELTTEYYRHLGRRRSKALFLATIPTAFGLITAVILVVIISPITLVRLSHNLSSSGLARIIVAALGLCIIVGLITLPFYQSQLSKLLKQLRSAIKSLRRPRQLLVVGVGSAAVILLCAMTLYASVRSVHGSISVVTVIVLYVTSLFVGNVAPTPGGLGAIEAVLVFGLSHAGLTLPEAVAATLIYRFATFWLPLVPGGLAMAQLNRQHRRRARLAAP
jgi:uncharacterized protein (TIRG00374 family)